jgi:hypothetical protein
LPSSRVDRCARRSRCCARRWAGHFDEHHRLWIGAILAHIDFLDDQIARLSVMIEEQIRPFASQVELLCTITGIQRRGAECILAEIGADMTSFVTARHLASWAGQCPGNDQSAGKRRSGRTREGSKWLDFALEEAAMSAIRVKDHYLEAQYRQLKPRRGHKRALGAVQHTILTAIWHMLSTGELYRDLGGDYFTRAIPNDRPDASSPSSNASGTPSPWLRALSELFLSGIWSSARCSLRCDRYQTNAKAEAVNRERGAAGSECPLCAYARRRDRTGWRRGCSSSQASVREQPSTRSLLPRPKLAPALSLSRPTR